MKVDHLAEVAAAGGDPSRERAYIDLVQVVAEALGLSVGDASKHVLRIISERAKR